MEARTEMALGPLTNAVHCWILDYYCQSTLREWAQKFEPCSNRYVRAANFLGDFSDDLIVNKDLQFKLELISWLPRLHSLSQQGKLEAYTEILREINTTKNISPESFSIEAKDFFNHLKKQCILLCCQKVGFSDALKIYEELDDNNKLDEESDKELSEILNSNDAEHDGLQCDIPSKISHIVSEYLKNHVIPSTTPFLITAATEALKEDEDSFVLSPAKKKKERCIEPDLLIQLAIKFKEDSHTSALSLDNSEKEVYLNKLKSIWHENHLKYHNKVKKFENEVISRTKDENGSGSPVESSVERPKRKITTNYIPSPDENGSGSPVESSVERPKRKITTNYIPSPVEKTFPEVKTITLRDSLRPPVTKKPVRIGHRVPWTSEQEEEFYLAVKKIGLGNWAGIRDHISFHKTNINLKDKWRNFHQSGRIEELILKFGKI